jgi:hypothetical protein
MSGGGGDPQARNGPWFISRSTENPARLSRPQRMYVALAFMPLVVIAVLGFIATR